MTKIDAIYNLVKNAELECQEPWKPLHDEVMKTHGLADTLTSCTQTLILLYQQMSAASPVTFEQTVQLCESFEVWYDVAKRIAERSADLVSEGYFVEQSDALGQLVSRMSSQLVEIKEIKNGVRQAIEGIGVGFDDFIDNLQSAGR